MEKANDTYSPLYDSILRCNREEITLYHKVILTKCIHLWKNTHKLNFSKSTMATWTAISQRKVVDCLHHMCDNINLNGGLKEGDEGYMGFFHIVVSGDNTKQTTNSYILNEKRINEYFGVRIFEDKAPIYNHINPTKSEDVSPKSEDRYKELAAAALSTDRPIMKKFNKVK